MAFKRRVTRALVPKLHPLLSIDDILGGAVPRDHAVCGLYFLIHNREIVYVGQSRNVHARIHQHRLQGEKQFDQYFVHPCPASAQSALEEHYILKFRPKYNATPIHPKGLADPRILELPGEFELADL